MAKILSINGYGNDHEGSNHLKNLWESFLSLDKFTKTILVTFLLIALVIPYIVTNKFSLFQYATQNGLVTFVDNSNTPIVQTTIPNVHLQLAPPDGWTLTSTQGMLQAYAQETTPTTTEPTPTLTAVPIQKSPVSCNGFSSYGDVNHDGAVSSADYDLIIKYTSETASLDSEQKKRGDVNDDGTVDTKDGLLIARYISTESNSITTFPLCTGLNPTTVIPTSTVTTIPTTPTVTVSSTPIIVLSPSPTASEQTLFKITIQNTDNGTGGDAPKTITSSQDIISAFNTPIAWKINPLASTESSAVRTIQVIYYAHSGNDDLQTTVAASITLVNVSPTSQVSPQGGFIRVFLTSTFHTGNLGGLNGADKICQSTADAAQLGGNWKAWLSDATASAASRLKHSNLPYMLVNGIKIADNWDGLISGSLRAPISVDEHGLERAKFGDGGYVWTDTTISGDSGTHISSESNCFNWTSTNGKYGNAANPRETNSYWTSSGYVTCSATYMRLYCIDQQESSNLINTPTAPTFPGDHNDTVIPTITAKQTQLGRPTATVIPEIPTATLVPGVSTIPTNATIPTIPPTVTPTFAPVIGDVDHNGCVGQMDFDILKGAFITQTAPSAGINTDLNHDGKTDIKDINIWFQAMRSGINVCH